MTAPARFKQADVSRALKAAAVVGLRCRIEIEPNGKIVIIPESPEQPNRRGNSWDDV